MNADVSSLLQSLSELNVKLDVNDDNQLLVSAPAGALTAELQQNIKRLKQPLIAQLVRAAALKDQHNLPQIEPCEADRFTAFPLNDIQHAYWIGRNEHMELGGVSTHYYCEFTCPSMDIAALSDAFAQVVQQHDMLRAVVTPDGQQHVLPQVPDYQISELDLRHNNEQDRQNVLDQIRSEMSQQVIDCANWPLFDIRAGKIAEDEVRLFFSWDFLVVDAWSIFTIFRQWADCYRQPGQQLTPLSLTFRDYLLAENCLKTGKGYQYSKDYWWHRLDDLPLAPKLPMINQIQSGCKYEFTRRSLSISAEQWQGLLRLAKSHAITPTNLLLAAFTEVLNMWSKSSHYCLNLTLFNRLGLHPQVMDLVGDFTTLLITEIGKVDHDTFLARAKAIQAQFLQDYAHKQISGVEVLREVAKRNGLTQTALMPVVFTSTLMLNEEEGSENKGLEQFGDLTFGITQTPQVWLDCQLFLVKGQLVINWDAVEALFEPNVLDKMFAALQQLLETLAQVPSTWTEAYPLEAIVDTKQTRTINEQALAQSPLQDANKLLHSDFVRQALAEPEHIALISGEARLSYGELLSLSVALALQLRAQQVQPNELVAVSMKKGWQQVVAVLAISMSGAAYLPIDPGLPLKRRQNLLDFSDVRILLSDIPGPLDYVDNAGLTMIEVLRAAQWQPISAGDLLADVQRQSDIAYVIFTSGSTGMPKGVVVSHVNALNTILAINQMFNVNAHDRVFAISSLSFDLSVYDIFGPLYVGAALVLPDDNALKDPAQWQQLIETHQVTVWNSAPQLMNMLLEYHGEKATATLASLRLVMMSGDWIKPNVPDQIKRLVPDCQVISLGGATEGSIWSIYHPITTAHPECVSIPYGKALPGQSMHIFNKQYQTCPEHVIGDIYIGGLGVAMGYLNDEQRSNERFILHPKTGVRLYWTGDIGRYLSDGNIEFLGREDRQVKLQGHRIELDEISSTLKAHTDIDDVMIQIIDGEQSQLLAAYIVAKQQPGSVLCDVVSATTQDLIPVDQLVVSTDDQQLADLAYFDQFWQQLTPLFLATMLDTVQQVIGNNHHDSLDGALAKAGVKNQYQFLVVKWLEILQTHDWISHSEGCKLQLNKDNILSIEQAFATFNSAFTVDERVHGFYEYIKSNVLAQAALLRGDVFPLELLFPQGNSEFAHSIYQSNPVAKHHNVQLTEALVKLRGEQRDDQPVRILEVGAGTGATTASLLARLPQHNTEYYFTDLSSFFFDQAKQKFSDVDCIKYAIYNVDNEPQSQGFSLHSFDFIVAANVLHDAKHIGRTLNNLRQLLKPSGHLVMIEGTSDTLWQWVTISYLEGVGSYEDFRAASHSPILSTSQWQRELGQSGFVADDCYPKAGGAVGTDGYYLQNAMPQHVIVARAPDTVYRLNQDKVKAHLSSLLPNYMVPQSYFELGNLPLTSNGKVDFVALGKLSMVAKTAKQVLTVASSNNEKIIATVWQEVLGITDISIDSNFFDLGGDSLLMTRVLARLNKVVDKPLHISDLFAFSTVRALAIHLADGKIPEPLVAPVAVAATSLNTSSDIAIIGLAGRFPDAADADKFWQNIASGVCSVRQFDDEQLLSRGVSQSRLDDDNYVKAGVVLEDMDKFDAGLFGINPREAQIIDPQIRVMLECAVTALEDAGYPNEQYGHQIGVFVGKDGSQYFAEHLVGRTDLIDDIGMMGLINVNEKDYLATQISYRLNLTGPSLNINTACSTSLVSIHQACQSLLNGESHIALAGGVSIETNHKGYLYKQGAIASPDGYCRAFSDDANGCVRGSGAGLVVLKPLAQALADNDTIHGVIKGSAINNDGRAKVGFTAPSVQGQANVIATAFSHANVTADTVQYIEAHGTGTHLGDPIETKALAQVFKQNPQARCAIGSLKTNMGHLDAAAGIASVIKSVYALKHAKMPPTLHFNAVNPALDLADGAIYVNRTLADWPAQAQGRRAGVSSFGVGGTNAHVILEQAPVTEPLAQDNGQKLMVLSAHSEYSLAQSVEKLRQFAIANPDVSLQDMAYTLQVGRSDHQFRSALVCDNHQQLIGGLSEPLDVVRMLNGPKPKVTFMFPGQGSQQLQTSYQLYNSQPVFQQSMDECADIIEMFMQQDIRAWLYKDFASAQGLPATTAEQIMQTSYAQPLLFAMGYSLAKLWMSMGVQPDAMTGHSLGEYVAACLAGVFTLEEALSLVVVRGHLMQSTEPGSMLAVRIEAAQLAELLLNSGCEIAANNGPLQSVVSGTDAAIDALAQRLLDSKVTHRKLETSHAFHSQLMDPVLDTFRECVEQVTLVAPNIPFVSNVTGQWITDEQATDPGYWVDHLRHMVKFANGIDTIAALGDGIFLEVGVGSTLTGMVKANGIAHDNVIASLGLLSEPADEYGQWLNSLKRLWLQGVAVDWTQLYPNGTPKRIRLPTYAFDWQSYWIAPFAAPVSFDRCQDQGVANEVGVIDSSANGDKNDSPVGQRNVYQRPNLSNVYVAATNEQQTKLGELWERCLGIKGIGIIDNYFELGGDSLQGIELNRKMKDELAINIPMDKLIQLGCIRNIINYAQIIDGRLSIDGLSDEEVDDILAVLDD